MRLEEASSAALEMLRSFDLGDWSFQYDRARQRVGACFYRERRISLSRLFVERNDDEAVLDTIRHEVAHALAWVHDREAGHGAAWRRWCQVTGAEPRRCYRQSDVTLPPARYQCTVLAKEVRWSSGAGARQRLGATSTPLAVGAVFGRHRLTQRLRHAVEIGLVEVLDSRTGRRVEA